MASHKSALAKRAAAAGGLTDRLRLSATGLPAGINLTPTRSFLRAFNPHLEDALGETWAAHFSPQTVAIIHHPVAACTAYASLRAPDHDDGESPNFPCSRLELDKLPVLCMVALSYLVLQPGHLVTGPVLDISHQAVHVWRVRTAPSKRLKSIGSTRLLMHAVH